MRKTAEGIINRKIAICGHPVYPGYVIRGSRSSMMIEAGLNLLGPTYHQGIEGILGKGSSLDYLLVTHGHYDHLGSIAYLKKKMPDVRLMGHEMAAQLLQKENVLKTMNFLSGQTWSYFEDFLKVRPEEESIQIKAVPFAGGLKEGDIIDLGDMHCVVYETPGHTRDHLSFFIPEEGILFPGEALGNAIMQKENEVKVEFLSSFTDHIRSMEKLTALLPEVKIIALSHLFYYTDDDVPRFVDMALRDSRRYKELIDSYLDSVHGDIGKATETMVRIEYDEKKSVYQERNAYMTNLQAQVKAVAALRALDNTF
jgi:glyoxylase-like metal-dependent hydrolase (beta-lactamase superfamily II)